MCSTRPCAAFFCIATLAGCGGGGSGASDAGSKSDGSPHEAGLPPDATDARAAEGGAPVDAVAETGGGDADGPSCETDPACSGKAGPGQSCVGNVDATLVDPAGAPAAGVIVTICGTNLCSSAVKSDASGAVHLSLCLYMTTPSLRIFDDPTWAPFAAALPAGDLSLSLGKVTVTPLPAAGQAFPPKGKAGTVSSNGASLDLAVDSVTLDGVHEALGADAREFRAVHLGPLPAALSGKTVSDVWGLAPENTVIAPGAALTLPNAMGWAAGAPVSFFLDGTDEATTAAAPWGHWGPIGDGAVSSDGKVITLASSGGGLTEIGPIGLQLK